MSIQKQDKLHTKHLTMYLPEIVKLGKIITFESAWLMTVFPQPNAPGMAQVPPSTEGKNASKTRCRKKLSREKISPDLSIHIHPKDITYIAQRRNWKKGGLKCKYRIIQLQQNHSTKLITCPVRSGVSAASLAATGLGERTGHAFMVQTTTQSLTNQSWNGVDTSR